MSAKNPTTVYRYERKYLSEHHAGWDLEPYIVRLPQIFHPVYYQREVWSMYFDTPQQEYYQQNLLGHPQRLKVRLRWYQEPTRTTPLQLEVKQREGGVMTKLIFPYEISLSETSLPVLTELVQQQLEALLPESYALQPTMVNHYQRRYYTSHHTSVRLTLDTALAFATVTDWTQGYDTHQLPHCILEAKYPVAHDPVLTTIVQGLPLRVSRSSKFVMGMQQCWPNDVYYQ